MSDDAEDAQLVAGRFRLHSELARGGVGVVYRAHDLSTGQDVALKRLLESATHNVRVTALFEREYHTLTRLRHPRIVKVFDYGIDKRGPYYTMELLDGRDLGELAPIPYRDACRYLRDIASSLVLLHTRSRLHRDLSPRNVRITSDGRCKLLDFGTMANFGVAEEIVGTPPMVPPEALRGMSLDHRADLYSLGALAYRVLTNRHAYRARQLEDLPELWRTPPPRLELLVPEVPEELDNLVMSMLSLDPVMRPTSTSEVIDRLTSIAELPPDEDRIRAAESYLLNSRLIGRTRQMETLHRRIARAHARRGSTVVIEGNPGVGKTRLLDEAALQAQLTGALTIRVEARSHRGPNAVAQALAKALLHAAPHDAREAAEPYAGVLGHFVEGLSASADRPSLPTDPSALRARLQQAFLSWLLDLSEDHTLVLLVDDLHRVDESSAAVLSALTQEAKDQRILLVTTRRLAGSVSAPEASAAIVAQARRLRLHRLRRSDTLALMHSIFGNVPNADELGNWIHDVTTGSPMQIIELSRHLVDNDIIRFVDSMWVLPSSVPKEKLPLSLAATMSARAAALPPNVRALAEALCVRRGSLSLPLCLSLAEEDTPSEVFKTIDDLVAKGVLVSSADGYRFGQDSLREVLLSELPAERERFLHRRLGEALLILGSDRPEDLIDAGWHILRGGDERRGADLLAVAAPKLGARGVATSAALPALEAALELYEKQGRSPRERIRLRTVIVGSMDRVVAARYSDDTMAALCYHAGANVSRRLQRFLGARFSFYAGIGFALVRRWFTREKHRGPHPFSAVSKFYRATYSLLPVRTSVMDVPGMERLTDQADAFTGIGSFGETTAMTCRAASYTLRALPGHSRKLQRRAIALAEGDPDFGDVGGGNQRAIRRGVLATMYINLGMVEAQYALQGQRLLDVVDKLAELSRESTLEVGDEIPSSGGITTPELTMAAHQIRMVFHLVRGERDKAEAHRGQLQLHTIQTGLQLQFDIWRTLIEIVTSARTRDVASLRRCVELLVNYVVQYPTLAPFMDMARAELAFSLGKVQEAVDMLGRWVPGIEPGAIAGWDALYASYAEALIAQGNPARAREVLIHVLRSEALTEDEFGLTALLLETHLALAESECGDVEPALQRIDRLMALCQHSDHPIAVGFLHETGARIAARAQQSERRDQHVELMKQWYALTRNPALIMRAQRVVDTLLESDLERAHPASLPPEQEATTRVTTQRQLVGIDALFEGCSTAEERAQRALHIIVESSEGTAGHLYLWQEDRLRLAASIEAGEPNDEVERILQDQVARFVGTDEPTTPHARRAHGDLAVISVAGEGANDEDRYGTFLLIAGGRSKQVVGAVALRIGIEMLRPMRKTMLESIARNLLEEGAAL